MHISVQEPNASMSCRRRCTKWILAEDFEVDGSGRARAFTAVARRPDPIDLAPLEPSEVGVSR